MLSQAVVTVTRDPNAQMQYKNFERDIVVEYGVDLVGWTHPSFKCPAKLSTSLPPLQTLLDALESGACRFVRLSKPERTRRRAEYQRKVASGDIITRKPRSDIGRRRGRAAKRPRHAHDSDSEGDSGSSSSEDEAGPAHKRRRPQQYKSAAIVIESD